MSMTRKQFGRLALASVLATTVAGTALAQTAYPHKPITMVVPAAAGGTTDLAARMAAQALGPMLGQTLVVATATLRPRRSSGPRPMATPC
jgi:tripartite-type tricarboxylate transporter receptor subunit TctC